ncbi:MAG: S9 family peptidase [Gammaproteobacteria bacterium]|nr:S9 family peptidase [Gammaproteobacteria bacterium]
MKKILLVLLALSLSSFAKAEIPVETFFKFPDITSVRISPDGKHLAATVESDGEKRLAIVDLKNTKIKTIFNFNSDNRQIGQYGWLNNERVYARMERKYGPLATPYQTGYMFAGNIDGKRKAQLMPFTRNMGKSRDFEQGFTIIDMLPNDDKHILISLRNRDFTSAYKLNVYKGTRKKIETSPEKGGSLITDHSGNVRVSSSYHIDEDKIKIHLKASPDSEWKFFKEYDAKKIGINFISFTKDNQKALVELREKGKARGIYTLDLVTGEEELVNEVSGDADIFRYVVDNDAKTPEVIGIKQMPGFVETNFFDNKHLIARIIRSLKQSFPGEEVEISNYTQDGKTALVTVWSDKNPGSFYLFDMEKYKLNFLLQSRPWIDRKKMASMKPISFNARDGLEIRGYLTTPNGKDKNLPMVVVVHGGPYGVKDNWSFNSEAQFLANRGYAVLQLNYRGSGGRGSKFVYENYKKMGREMQDDITDGTLWAVEQGIANKDRICIYGGSYGGYAAMMGVIREPDLYKCSIPYVGVYDINMFKYDIYHRTESGRKSEKEMWGYGDEEFMKERSPAFHVDKVKAALFLVHGGKDPICPIEHYDALTDALDKRNYPYESLVETYEGHGFADPDNRVKLYTRMEQFLEKHIGK